MQPPTLESKQLSQKYFHNSTGSRSLCVCRYVLLYTFGGFYMDLDIECYKPMDALRAYPFIMPQTRPVGFSNDFLASTPGEAFPSELHAVEQKHAH